MICMVRERCIVMVAGQIADSNMELEEVPYMSAVCVKLTSV